MPPSPVLYRRALEIQLRYRFSCYDALIVAAAVVGGCTRLLTEDLQDGQRIKGVTVVNPLGTNCLPVQWPQVHWTAARCCLRLGRPTVGVWILSAHNTWMAARCCLRLGRTAKSRKRYPHQVESLQRYTEVFRGTDPGDIPTSRVQACGRTPTRSRRMLLPERSGPAAHEAVARVSPVPVRAEGGPIEKRMLILRTFSH